MKQFFSAANVSKFSSIVENALSVLVLLAAAFTVAWLLWFSRYGFDFTDEGFYLNWISRPFNYPASSSQFGFIYHPLYLAVSGDIASLRQGNILLSFGLAWVAGWVLLSNAFFAGELTRTSRFAISAAIASSAPLALVFAGLWLPTPSYNSLTFQGLLVALIGLMLAEKELSRTSILGWMLIAFGGWLTFMAKPTSAAVLALISGIYVLLAGKFRVVPLAVALGTTFVLLLLAALVIDGSVLAFVERLRAGAGLATVLDSSYTFDRMFRLDSLHLNKSTALILFAVSAMAFCVVWLAWFQIGWIAVGAQILSAGLATIGFLTLFHFFSLQSGVPGHHRGLVLFAVPFGAACAGLTMSRFKGLLQICRAQRALLLALLALPYAYAFGTGNNYWIPIACAGVSIVLAGYLFLGQMAPDQSVRRIFLTVGLSVQAVSIALLASGLASPYRQPQPLSHNDAVMEVGWPGSALILAKNHSDYLSLAIKIVRQAGFTHGVPMIDLTGHSPGLVYALGANSVGLAWALGGYKGSNQFAISGLKEVPCEQLAAAWILSEPDGPMPLSPNVLSSLGANIDSDFERVGSLVSPDGHTQHLLRPVRAREVAIERCKATKDMD